MKVVRSRTVALFYELALYAGALAALPKFLYSIFRHNKYKSNFSYRCGGHFPSVNTTEKPLIWIHAVSVGEARAVSPLAKLIRSEHPHATLLISSVTETGHAEAKRSMPFADYHVYLPFDFRWLMKKIINKAAPHMVIISESDFWYNFLRFSADAGARIALVNGKISERSAGRYAKFPAFARALFSHFDVMCLQNGTYAERFEQLYVSPKNMAVTGNLKFDAAPPALELSQLNTFKRQLGIQQGEPVIAFGSTHETEEELIFSLLPQLRARIPNLKVLIIPRHPERFNAVAELIIKHGFPFQRYTQAAGQSTPVTLVDAMGLLRHCYQLADIAVVGGSFKEGVGGHNIIEPACYGVPVVFGPHMFAQADLVALVKEYEAGVQVNGSELGKTLLELLQNGEKREKLGANGRKMIAEMQGSAEKTMAQLRPVFENVSPKL